jgi:uncharacterized membrane protein
MIGLGVGLASVAGVRAFLPLALAALFSVLGLFDFSAPFVALDGWALFAALGALAVLEGVLDKVRSVERYFNYAMIPLRAASGAVLFSAAQGLGVVAEAVPWLAAGALVAGVVAVLKVVLRPPSGASAGVSAGFLSLIEDAVALVGGVVGIFVPVLPLLLVVFLLFFFHRIRRRRGRKFGGLRILGD